MAVEVGKIKKILLREHYISPEDNKAAEDASHDTASYIEYLMTHELLSKTLLGQALAESIKLPFVDLSANPVTADQLALIPESTARALRVVVASGDNEQIVVATDGLDKLALRKQRLHHLFPTRKISLAYTLPEYIDTAFNSYDQPLETRFSHIISSGTRIAPEIVDAILGDALSYGASDIHFEPRGDEAIIRFRIDGNLREAGKVPKQYYENILNRIKVEGKMRIDEHMTAQDGAIQRLFKDHRVDLRVSLVPTVEGEKIAIRILGSYVHDYSLNDIGLTEKQRATIEAAAAKPFGMILVTGPTGSGKTTTLYALLKLLNKPSVNIMTIEDPVEYKMLGVNQIQVQEGTNLTFARGLRAIVRQDPNIILVGEVRDQETAEISVNAALTGHLLLSTFHANDAGTAVPRLLDMGIEPFLLASTLEIVIAQRLVRRICNSCRYSVPAHDVVKSLERKVNLKPFMSGTHTLFAGKGCVACSGSGYNGRVALFEFIEVTPELQELIAKHPATHEVRDLARKQGSQAMFYDGVQKAKDGLTTMAEVVRVVEPPRRKGE